MDLDRIVGELEAERDRLSGAIALLKGAASRAASSKTPGRGMTPAGRKRLSELMKKRWAERRKKRS